MIPYGTMSLGRALALSLLFFNALPVRAQPRRLEVLPQSSSVHGGNFRLTYSLSPLYVPKSIAPAAGLASNGGAPSPLILSAPERTELKDAVGSSTPPITRVRRAKRARSKSRAKK